MKLSSYKIAGTLIWTVLSLGAPCQMSGQAFCALRDPISIIQSLEPESSGHKSIVKVVGGSVRAKVSEKLPFTIHFNELGKHTVYVIMKDDQPEGIVHTRSEKGDWGMVEVVWYLNFDLTVRDFKFQRCRDRARRVVEADAFANQIRGKGFAEIRGMLNSEGDKLSRAYKKCLPGEAAPLAVTTLRSALKTIVVTELVWGGEINAFAQPGPVAPVRSSEAFGGASAKLVKVEFVYTDAVLKTLSDLEQDDESIINRATVEVHKAYGSNDTVIGLRLCTECNAHETPVQVNWDVDRRGAIEKVSPSGSWPSDDIEAAFTGLENFSLEQARTCSTLGQLAAIEVLAISKSLLHQ